MKIISIFLYLFFLICSKIFDSTNSISIKFSSNNIKKNDIVSNEDLSNIIHGVSKNKSIYSPHNEYYNKNKGIKDDLNNELDLYLNENNNIKKNYFNTASISKLTENRKLENIENSLKTIYLKNQLDIDFFKEKNILELLKNKEKKSKLEKFEIIKEREYFLSNTNDYLLNHNNIDIFKVIFANFTNSIESENSLINSYLSYSNKREKMKVKSNSESNNKNTSWKYNFISKEYELPLDSK